MTAETSAIPASELAPANIGGGGEPGTVAWLIDAYLTDLDSPFQRLRYVTKQNYMSLLRRIDREHGSVPLVEIRGKTIRRWHAAWVDGGKVTMAHSMVAMFRALVSFGCTDLEDRECERLRGALSAMRFKLAKPRTERLTSEQVAAIRETAREYGYPSIALSQAIQFECILRQRDCLGEWVPEGEPGDTDIRHKEWKWLRGVRWEEIDENLILRHVTSKRQKELEVNLTLAPMVMEEFRYAAMRHAWMKLGAKAIMDPSVPKPGLPDVVTRADLPIRGPIVVCEITALPWEAHQFRRAWRNLATVCGIPKDVWNMDSRAGAITEATDAGADLEHVRHAATHGDITMTQKYSRGAAEKIARVQQARVVFRQQPTIARAQFADVMDEAIDEENQRKPQERFGA